MSGMTVCLHNETTVLTKEFKGDILITDPCYICKKDRDESGIPKHEDFMSYSKVEEYLDYDGRISITYNEELQSYWRVYNKWREDNPSDWERCEYGDNFEELGIHNYMTHSTLYGDWSCTTYDKDTKEAIGEFCADAGLVSVFLLDEVRKYNPEIDKTIKERPWCFTTISNFEGVVSFIVVHEEGTYDEDTEYWKKGDPWTDDILIVEGTGNINFTTRQTGL